MALHDFMTIVGRTRELERLHALMKHVETGAPGTVMVDGPGGMGKTSLVHRFLTERGDLTSLRASGDEAESGLSFGMLAQLAAARAPFSPWEGSTDPIVAGLELLDLLGRLQEAGPIIVVVDDAQWADAPSLQALTFALRRLRADSVLTIVIARSPAMPRIPPGLRRLLTGDQTVRLTLAGLGAADLRELAGGLGVRLPLRAAERLREQTNGNPLHARELIGQVPPEVLTDLSRPLPVPRTYFHLVLERLNGCSRPARNLVYAAGVLGFTSPLDAVGRLSGIDDPVPPFDEAVRARLLLDRSTAAGLTALFPHPLTHAAVYQNLSVLNRRELHRRAAELADSDQERLRHRVRASHHPDDALAADLTAFARGESATGNWSSTAEHLINAAHISPSQEERAHRTAEAIASLIYAGRVEDAAELAAGLPATCPVDIRCFALGALALAAGNPAEAVPLLTEAWERCDAAAHPVRAVRIAECLSILCGMAGSGPDAVLWVERATSSATGVPHPDFLGVIHMCALASRGRSDTALALARDLPASVAAAGGGLDRLLGRAAVRMWNDDLDGAIEDASRALSRSDRHSAAYRVSAHAFLGEAEFRAGRWDDAAAHTLAGVSLAEDTGQGWMAEIPRALAALVPAARGRFDEAEPYVAAGRASRASPYSGLPFLNYALAFTATARGLAEGVVAALEPVTTRRFRDFIDEPGLLPWQDLLADAYTRLGRHTEARAVLDPFEERAADRGRHSSLALIGRARGNLLMAQGDFRGAESSFEAALVHAARVDLPFDRARLHLDYGIFLRRRKARGAALRQLESAHAVLWRLRAVPYLRRCERELTACGRPAAAPGEASGWNLTPQEHAVARLACSGMTNQQIAKELVLSVKTVEFHLGKVFGKLGVASRAALCARLRGDDRGDGSADGGPGPVTR
ncbi:regulatory protein, luxR family [Sinosporangium album]|uniref:Regulatory protein, luxR family n=1 Tax=Sinosporangium album TaxID=504805 RepID=A0A1G8DNB5_9ACTN|nr:helix-turn-helix transcriptional regulator [Sinosporangium album]SDH59183.1 regulatory protein, luxR family [Sinosporangium album]